MKIVAAVLFVLLGGPGLGQDYRYQPSPIAVMPVNLTFKQKLEKATAPKCERVSVKVIDLDTVGRTFSLDISVPMSKKALTYLSRKFGVESLKSEKKVFHLVTKKSSFYDVPGAGFVIGDSAVQLASLNKAEINNPPFVAIGLEIGKFCPVLDLYFEFGEENWYFLRTECWDMKAVSSDQQFNDIITKTARYDGRTFVLTSRRKKDIFCIRLRDRTVSDD